MCNCAYVTVPSLDAGPWCPLPDDCGPAVPSCSKHTVLEYVHGCSLTFLRQAYSACICALLQPYTLASSIQCLNMCTAAAFPSCVKRALDADPPAAAGPQLPHPGDDGAHKTGEHA
eukprot:scaffold9257_cov28-Tisochrysis_lutea.AAC.1